MKFSVILMPAVAQAAVRVSADFPKFATTLATKPDTTILDGATVEQKATMYFAYRAGYVVFMPQRITSAGAVITGAQAFWNTLPVTTDPATDLLNVYYPTKAERTVEGTLTGTTQKVGSLCVICQDNKTNGDPLCFGGTKKNITGTAKIDNRLAVMNTKDGSGNWKTSSLTTDGTAVVVTNEHNFDLIMASFHQYSQAADGSTSTGAWCSKWLTKLTTGQQTTVEGLVGVGKQNKCTWQITTANGTEGMAIKMKADSKNIAMLVQFVEFIDPANTGTSTVLGNTEVATYYPGKYDPTKGVFLNPMKENAVSNLGTSPNLTTGSAIWSWQYNLDSCEAFLPKSIGFVAQYNGSEKVAIKESSQFMQSIEAINKATKSFNDLVTKHNENVAAYNTLADAWIADQSKDLKEVTRIIPKTSAGSYTKPTLDGLKLDYDDASAFETDKTKTIMTTAVMPKDTSLSDTFKQMAVPKTSWKFAEKDTKHSASIGYLEANPASGTKVNTNVGHAFGRIGQGDDIDTLPYMYQKTPLTSAQNGPTMNLSIFPDNSDGLLGANEKIHFDVKASKWLTNADLAPIDVTSVTTMSELSAQKMFASLLVGATVFSTLY